MALPSQGKVFAAKIATFFGAIFFAIGVYLPFFPVWLAVQGLNETEIALIIAAPFFIRAVFSPTLALLADLFPDLKFAAGAYGIATALFFAALAFATGFWPIFLFSALAMVFWSALIPIGDALAIVGVRQHGIDYGRVRLWGSVMFIVANFATAEVLRATAEDGVFVLLIVTYSAAALIAFWLPGAKTGDAMAPPARLRELVAEPQLRLAVLAGSLILAAHATYYAFGSLFWREHGFSPRTIAALWAFSVVIEVVLFFLAKKMTGWDARRFMIAAGLGGLLRWTLFPLATGPVAAFALQALHSLTFAAAYLAIIMSIGATSAPGHTGRLQAGFQLVSGVLTAFATIIAGPLYGFLPALAFWLMAAMSAAGLFIAFRLSRGMRPPGEAQDIGQPQRAASGGATSAPG